jgi:hypothetical protein
MRIFAIILLLVGLGSAGLGIMHYIQYTDLRRNALTRLEKAEQLYGQAAPKQGTVEGRKLIEEANTSQRDSRSLLDSAQQPKGYATIDWIVSVVAVLLSGVLFILLSRRRRRNYESVEASSTAY